MAAVDRSITLPPPTPRRLSNKSPSLADDQPPNTSSGTPPVVTNAPLPDDSALHAQQAVDRWVTPQINLDSQRARSFNEVMSFDHHEISHIANTKHHYKYVLMMTNHYSLNTVFIVTRTTSAAETYVQSLFDNLWFSSILPLRSPQVLHGGVDDVTDAPSAQRSSFTVHPPPSGNGKHYFRVM